VQVFDARGEYLFKFGSVGDRAGLFANPKGIALDSAGHIYVTDAASSNFQIFDQQGNVLLDVGSMGPAPGQMHLPGGIAIDDQDLIYVADQLNRRIEVFQYLKDAP
jgi:DNA-binding beta-propeller fold protein YncE